MDSNGAGDDGHDVLIWGKGREKISAGSSQSWRVERRTNLGEGSGFISTDDGSVGHGLTGSEETDEEVLLGHSLGGEGESERDGQRETLRDGDNNDGDRNDENVDEGLSLLSSSPNGDTGAELSEESDEERGEEDETGEGSEFSDEFGEGVELELEGSGRGVSSEG